MTDPDYTHITFVADRSGSMGMVSDPPRTKADDTTKGVQDMVREQSALPGKITFSLADFMISGHPGARTTITKVAWFAPPGDKDLTSWVCRPYGGTPLLDALGTIITETGQALEAMPDSQRPGRVIFVIGTDGEENSSHEYSKAQVKQMVTHQREAYGWDFVFIGVDIDAFTEGAGIGVAAASTASVDAAGTASAYLSTNSAVTRSRGPGGQSVSYSDEERKAMKERK